ncbi:MAG: transcriptional regulator [Dehalococcoidia bacterium]|nr:transcriptional regulator [Dehalococcoidia bacterium]
MAEKKVVSIRLAEDQVEYLYRTARRLGRTPSQTAALLIEDAHRRERYPEIEMRDTAAGRKAYIRRTRLPVWMMAKWMWAGTSAEELHESIGHDAGGTLEGMRAALAYAEEYRDEIEQDIEADRLAGERLKQTPGHIVIKY